MNQNPGCVVLKGRFQRGWLRVRISWIIIVFCSSVNSRSEDVFNHLFRMNHHPEVYTWGIASLRQTTDFTPGYIAERACRCWISLAWWRRLHTNVDQWQCVVFRSVACCHERTRCQRQTMAAWLPVFVDLKRGVNNASDWPPAREAAHIDFGAMSSAVFWIEACCWQKSPGIRHDESFASTIHLSCIWRIHLP
jgi:hypothetical protein